MIQFIRHDREQESIEAKTRSFRSLPMAERMQILCSFTDLALSLNPDLKDKKNAEPVALGVAAVVPSFA